MPASVVKTSRDERLWDKAKLQAEKQGRASDYAYIMGIFQRMKGEKSMDNLAKSITAPLDNWLEKADPIWELVGCTEDFAKAAGHKYAKRVVTGKPKPKYRYYYKVPGKGLVSSEHLHSGAKYKSSHDDKHGHFEVVHHDKEKGTVKVKHDESGKEVHMKVDEFANMINEYHGKKKDEEKKTAPKKEAKPKATKEQKEKLADAIQTQKKKMDEEAKEFQQEVKQENHHKKQKKYHGEKSDIYKKQGVDVVAEAHGKAAAMHNKAAKDVKKRLTVFSADQLSKDAKRATEKFHRVHRMKHDDAMDYHIDQQEQRSEAGDKKGAAKHKRMHRDHLNAFRMHDKAEQGKIPVMTAVEASEAAHAVTRKEKEMKKSDPFRVRSVPIHQSIDDQIVDLLEKSTSGGDANASNMGIQEAHYSNIGLQPHIEREIFMRDKTIVETPEKDFAGYGGNGGLAEWWKDATVMGYNNNPKVLRPAMMNNFSAPKTVVIDDSDPYTRNAQRVSAQDSGASLDYIYHKDAKRI